MVARPHNSGKGRTGERGITVEANAYVVRLRRGGKLHYSGRYPTLAEAVARRDALEAEFAAAGIIPTVGGRPRTKPRVDRVAPVAEIERCRPVRDADAATRTQVEPAYLAHWPTQSPPRSSTRVHVYRARAERGLPLFNPLDHGNGDVLRRLLEMRVA